MHRRRRLLRAVAVSRRSRPRASSVLRGVARASTTGDGGEAASTDVSATGHGGSLARSRSRRRNSTDEPAAMGHSAAGIATSTSARTTPPISPSPSDGNRRTTRFPSTPRCRLPHRIAFSRASRSTPWSTMPDSPTRPRRCSMLEQIEHARHDRVHQHRHCARVARQVDQRGLIVAGQDRHPALRTVRARERQNGFLRRRAIVTASEVEAIDRRLLDVDSRFVVGVHQPPIQPQIPKGRHGRQPGTGDEVVTLRVSASFFLNAYSFCCTSSGGRAMSGGSMYSTERTSYPQRCRTARMYGPLVSSRCQRSRAVRGTHCSYPTITTPMRGRFVTSMSRTPAAVSAICRSAVIRLPWAGAGCLAEIRCPVRSHAGRRIAARAAAEAIERHGTKPRGRFSARRCRRFPATGNEVGRRPHTARRLREPPDFRPARPARRRLNWKSKPAGAPRVACAVSDARNA